MTNNIISVLCILYGAGFIAANNMGYVQTLNIPQVAAAITGGIALLGYNNFTFIASLFKGKIAKSNKAGNIYAPQEFEIRDHECLIHLRERLEAAQSQEGLEVINKLNGIMFALHEKDNTNTNTAGK